MNGESLTVIFASGSGPGFHHAKLIGSPVTKITCTCLGYLNQKSCKHINAILEADPLLAVPTPTEGYEEAIKAMVGSPAQFAYERLINGLLNIDEKILVLKSDARTAKKMFYRMLSEGITR